MGVILLNYYFQPFSELFVHCPTPIDWYVSLIAPRWIFKSTSFSEFLVALSNSWYSWSETDNIWRRVGESCNFFVACLPSISSIVISSTWLDLWLKATKRFPPMWNNLLYPVLPPNFYLCTILISDAGEGDEVVWLWKVTGCCLITAA